MSSLVGRASVPAAFGGTGFPACAPHRQDAGATKNFSEQEMNYTHLKKNLQENPLFLKGDWAMFAVYFSPFIKGAGGFLPGLSQP